MGMTRMFSYGNDTKCFFPVDISIVRLNILNWGKNPSILIIFMSVLQVNELYTGIGCNLLNFEATSYVYKVIRNKSLVLKHIIDFWKHQYIVCKCKSKIYRRMISLCSLYIL